MKHGVMLACPLLARRAQRTIEQIENQLRRLGCTKTPLIRFRLHIAGLRVDIVGSRVALVHMIGFEDMARVHMALVHSVRAALTHRVVAGMGATVPVRR